MSFAASSCGDINRSHPTFAEFAENAIVRDGPANHGWVSPERLWMRRRSLFAKAAGNST